MSDHGASGTGANGTGANGRGENGQAATRGPANGGVAPGGPADGDAEHAIGPPRLASLTLVPKADEKLGTRDFKSDQEVRWCPGCGDYAILAAFQAFLPELEIPRENLVMISGIGCSSRLPYYVNSYGMHSIHGRAPAIATGLASSRPDLSVWVITGDGDALSIGANHLIHALRRNVNIKVLLFNNRIYGLTKGQYSPTSETGKVTKSTPFGSLDTPFNPVSLALGAEASFVARTIDSDRKHLTGVLRAAADHKGAAFVEIYQNCPIFNDDAFAPVTEPGSREEHLIRLEHGAPIQFGAGGGQGLRFSRYGSLQAVHVAQADPDSLLTHDAHADDPSYAFALSRLDSADFAHTPIGLFRQVVRPSYDELMSAQLEEAREKQGDGDLAALLAGNDTWQVG
jgi:2-oxoglutarate ferredoxin oxidoreductase subunit beta